MLPKSRGGNGSSGASDVISKRPRRKAMAIFARHQLLSDSWTADVENLESAIGRFKADSNVANSCEVVFFEIAGDRRLHCNVTHRHPTKAVAGWAGPGHVPGGSFIIGASVTRHTTRSSGTFGTWCLPRAPDAKAFRAAMKPAPEPRASMYIPKIPNRVVRVARAPYGLGNRRVEAPVESMEFVLLR